MNKTVLIFGGGSDERLVSVASAQNLSNRFPFSELWFVHEGGAISRTTTEELGAHAKPFVEKFQPREAAFAKNLREAVPALKGCTVYMGFHGTEGEDGTIQKLFEDAGIAFTGSGSRASQLCFDKLKAKETVTRAGLPTAEQLTMTPGETYDSALTRMSEFLKKHGKMVLKPVANGSSVGLFIISERSQLEAALKKVVGSPYGAYMAEGFVQGRELTVGVLQRGNKNGNGDELTALPASEVVLKQGHSFDYEGKYLGRGSTELTPAPVTLEEMEAAKKLSLAAHKALGCFGYTRTDMILTEKGLVYIETNTLPGLTKASFFPQQLEVLNISMREFIESQLALANQRK